MGMDPYSFGYATTTKPEDYRSAANIIHTLLDIVSKRAHDVFIAEESRRQAKVAIFSSILALLQAVRLSRRWQNPCVALANGWLRTGRQCMAQ